MPHLFVRMLFCDSAVLFCVLLYTCDLTVVALKIIDLVLRCPMCRVEGPFERARHVDREMRPLIIRCPYVRASSSAACRWFGRFDVLGHVHRFPDKPRRSTEIQPPPSGDDRQNWQASFTGTGMVPDFPRYNTRPTRFRRTKRERWRKLTGLNWNLRRSLEKIVVVVTLCAESCQKCSLNFRKIHKMLAWHDAKDALVLLFVFTDLSVFTDILLFIGVY